MEQQLPAQTTPGVARWEFLNVSHIIERAGVSQDAVAVVIDDSRRTYGELRDRSRRVGNALLGAGLQPEQRVAITAKNCIEYFEVEFGVSGAAGILVPMSWRLSSDERVRLLQRSQSRVPCCRSRLRRCRWPRPVGPASCRTSI